jgi:hypothetical protein
MTLKCLILFLLILPPVVSQSQPKLPAADQYNVVWTSQSTNSGESMPCGGGDIGLNVWAEKGEILFYLARSGTFDENNAFLKLGRVRLKLTPNPFDGSAFRQELKLNHGYVNITGSHNGVTAEINVWVDVFQPVIHAEIKSNKPLKAEAIYESWRHADRISEGKENNANSYKWASREVKTYKDEISFRHQGIVFLHRNKGESVFDVTVRQQGLEHVKEQMFNPLHNRTFGGLMIGVDMVPADTVTGKYLHTLYKGWKLTSLRDARSHSLKIILHTGQTTTVDDWHSELQKNVRKAAGREKNAWKETRAWWTQYWKRSYIYIEPRKANAASAAWQAGRNYKLFRYMLGGWKYAGIPLCHICRKCIPMPASVTRSKTLKLRPDLTLAGIAGRPSMMAIFINYLNPSPAYMPSLRMKN